MKIECSECEMYQTDQCDDCLVTALLHPPTGPLEIDEDLDPPLQALAGAGLIPVLRFRRRDPGEERETELGSSPPAARSVDRAS
ncbi:MAG: hypothetical protein ABR579_10890 [Actinomycetota bacterium]